MYLDINEKREVLNKIILALEACIRQCEKYGKPRDDYNTNICDFLDDALDDNSIEACKYESNVRREAFKSWIFYSGDPRFPIPHEAHIFSDETHRSSAESSFWEQCSNMWEGVYGILRWSACCHLLRTYKKELSKLEK